MRRWAPFGLLLVALGLLAGRWLSSERVPDAGPGQVAAASGEGSERTALAADPRGDAAAARALRGRPRILGQVLEGGRPVRARVELFPVSPGTDDVRPAAWGNRRPMAAGGLPRAVAVRDADEGGRFVFEDVAAARFVVVARAGSGARGWSLADTRPAQRDGVGERADVHVRGGAETLRGRVRTAEGAAWRGSVGVGDGDSSWWPAEALRLQPTDADGRFEVTGLPPGPATVELFEAGRVRFTGRAVQLPYAGELDIVLPATGSEMRCVVRDSLAGRPILGAEVETSERHALGSLAHATWSAVTDAAGEARLPVAPGGLRVCAAGYEPAWVSTEDLPAVLEVRLRALGAVDVLVVDARTKAPVAGALVIGLQPAASLVPQRSQPTDGAGRCRLSGLAEGENTVFVAGGGWCSAEIGAPGGVTGTWPRSLACDVRSDGMPSITREVVPLAVVAGRVLDAEGRPVAYARVVARSGVVHSLAGGAAPALSTAPDGGFEGAVLVPGIGYDLEVNAVGHASVLTGPLGSAAGERVVRDVRLEAGRFVNARVIEAGSNRPIPGARLHAWADLGSRPDRPGSHWVGSSGVTDTAGAVRLGPFLPAALRIHVLAPGFRGPPVLEVAAGEPLDRELSFVLSPMDLRIAGRVRFEDGTSARDVTLDLGGEAGGSCHVDDQGRFLVEGLVPGEYVLEFRHGDVEEALLERPATAGDAALEVVLPAPRQRALTFRVLGADGSPIDSVAYACGAADHELSGRVQRGVLRVVPFVGAAWFLFSGAQDDRGRALPWAPTGVGPFAADGRTIEVRMHPGRSVGGSVVDETGRGVAGVSVRAWPLAPPTPEDPALPEVVPEIGVSTTDASGRFELPGLDGTTYRLSVDSPKGYAEAASVDVRGGDADVRLVLPRPADVVLTVIDPLGRPVVGAAVARRCFSELNPIPPTGADGRTTLPAISPDLPIALKVAPPKDRSDLRWLEVAGWRRGDPPIVLPAARTVRGVVVDEAGRPVPGAEITVLDMERGRHETRAREDGRFVADGLPVGDVEAYATTEEPARLASSRVRAAAGSGDLRLVLLRGVSLRVRLDGGVGRPEDAEVVLTSVDGAPTDVTAEFGPDGIATFQGLDPRASYALLLTIDEPIRLVAVARDVRGDVGEVSLRPEPPRTLVGRVRGAPVGSDVYVSIEELGLEIEETARSDGAFALEDVPPGPFTIRAECETPSGPLVGSARGSTAARVEIVLAPAAGGRR